MKSHVSPTPSSLSVSFVEKEAIRTRLIDAGAVAVGFAKAEEVEPEAVDFFNQWIERGDNAGMDYMHNYPDLRRDPRLLLDDAKTIISLAFSFAQSRLRPANIGYIAQYAYGKDYHKELRKIILPIIKSFEDRYGAKSRVCIDSAPIMERYWAQKAGIGFTADNGALIVPQAGSMVFLAEIITTLEITPDLPMKRECDHCGLCRNSCPGKAIKEDGTIDARQCLSYLTIEHHGPFTNNLNTLEISGNIIFGCDRCLTNCPHNQHPAPIRVETLLPSDQMLSITSEDFMQMNSTDFDKQFSTSPLRRSGLSALQRNIRSL